MNRGGKYGIIIAEKRKEVKRKKALKRRIFNEEKLDINKGRTKFATV